MHDLQCPFVRSVMEQTSSRDLRPHRRAYVMSMKRAAIVSVAPRVSCGRLPGHRKRVIPRTDPPRLPEGQQRWTGR